MVNQVALRAIEPEDVEILYQWENNMELWVVSDTQKPFSRHQLQQYIKGINLDIYQSKELRLMIETEEENPVTIGIIDLFDFDPFHNRAGVGIIIHKDFEGKGFASKALDLFIDYCFNNLGIFQLYCTIATNNTRSIKLFESKGFIKTGIRQKWRKIGKDYIDEAFYQLINE
ncbi:GNAT family N-acetyltransferase [Plebeiibacterium marinum]|uniref:GNAT family N-acetyltransferase n=1 Tax=Plebeiibacterium marinum TaxID=2992111 RepID=A0AAE3MCH3_9BACT|nr:GNAT family N-acetyltransferase [Plebeiobacterium marinum]MCW3805017.1 GNAT family N-acetyltransferase [Plebeiobacterium marinum]